MSQPKPFQEYITSVCAQIRWKKAHPVIATELRDHLTDQEAAFLAEGLPPEEAAAQTILTMGDPVTVGTQLDRTYRPKPKWGMFVLTGIFLAMGIGIVLLLPQREFSQVMLIRMMFSSVLGLAAMAVTYYWDFSGIGKHPKILFFLLWGGVFAAVIPTSGMLGFNVSVFLDSVLLLFPVILSGIIYSMRNRGYWGVFWCGVYFLAAAAAGFLIPAIGKILLCGMVAIPLLTLAIMKGWFRVRKSLALLMVCLPTLSILLWFLYLGRNRFAALLIPTLEPLGAGYINNVIKGVLQGAKWIGQGTFAPIPALSSLGVNPPIETILPDYSTQFILTSLIYRYGLISFVLIMAVVLIFIVRAFVLCHKQKSILGRLVSTSITLTFTFQVLSYVLCNLGVGVSISCVLPLISYGNTATVVNMALIGILLSVFKSGELVKDTEPRTSQMPRQVFTFGEGKLTIDFGKLKLLPGKKQ